MDWQTMLGLPADPVTVPIPPGFASTASLDQAPPPVSSAQSIWDTIKQDSIGAVNFVENEVSNAYGGVKNIASTVYGDISAGVGTVVSDVTKPFTTAYWYLILAVVVIGGALYYMGKGGGVKVNAIV